MSEKRVYPRVNVSFPIKITPSIIGQATDISQTGIGFILERPLLLSKAVATIETSAKQSFKSQFNVIWNKQLVLNKGLKYGACFIRLKKKDISILRDVLIRSTIDPILDAIDDAVVKKKVLGFWERDIKKYMDQLDLLTEAIKSNKISLIDAYSKGSPVSNNIMEKANEIESLVNNRTISKKMKEAFRFLCGPWAYKGKIVKRGYEKPRGYSGDYLMLEAVYDNKSTSEDIGYCCDMYFLNNKYAIAVRNRKDMMKAMLLEHIKANGSSEIDILNIACGPCREIAEGFSKGINFNKKINFNLVDFDEEALFFSEKSLSFIKTDNIAFKYLKHNVLRYASKEKEKYASLLGQQDFIYSIGLADYLPDKMFKKIISFCFKLLKPKGSFSFAHKDILMYKPVDIDWWCDWTFYSRDEKRVLALISECEIENFDLKVEREPSGVIFFVTITKK
jgi:extracellular factor (EF) 3-hydroxypalmitic acid methyl ester biosynthesis protein